MQSSRNIPGYTGFVPFKAEFFGATTCTENRAAETVYRAQYFKSTGKSILELQSGDV
jgi:hypothetical protein